MNNKIFVVNQRCIRQIIKCRLCGIVNSSDDFLKFLNTRDLRLGVAITINSVEEFDGSMNVSYDKHKTESLSNVVCERLLVEG